MADKKSLFAGRTGDKTAKRPDTRKKKADAPPPPPSPPPPDAPVERKRPVSYGRGGAARGVAVNAQRREIQVKEAEDYLKQANKCLQKTMTRWNPNYFSAAPLFEKAGACYRAAGEDGKATAMYTQAGECQCHDTVSAHASAAKDFREAALITERQGRNDEASALFLRCAEAWVHADEPGRAADYLGRSAKLAADADEDEAAERTNFLRVVGACDVMVQAINFLATVNRLEECMQVVERYCILLQAESIEHSLARMYLTYCILALARGDYVKADAVFRDEHLQSTAYLHSEECRVEEELLTAFKDLRPDLLTQVQQDRTLRRLDTVIVRLAKSLRLPGDDEEGNTDDLAKDSLFGGARKASPPLAPTTALEEEQALEERSGLPTAVPRRGYHEEVYHEEVYHEEIYHEEPGEADVDLGLGDLEATLDGAAEDDCDDLDAMIEAARKEAAGLGLGGGGAGSDEESDEDDIDLT
eukprot:jgi/Undpi1/11504/HiC_scaffold_30.g13801.m1